MSDSMYGPIEPMHSEAIPPHDSVERVNEIIERIIGERISRNLTDNQRAVMAWHGANGDRERTHTTRVFLKQARVDGADPIMCVYVDSHAFVTDLMANKDLYLSRLANWGFSVSGIEFSVDREAMAERSGSRASTKSGQEGKASCVALEELSDEQRLRVSELVEEVPDSLKDSISKAIAASLQANC